jgi:xanthosine utilization system XapX-like protein
MSYNSKKAMISIVAGILLVIAYIIYALRENSPAPDDLKSWAVGMLLFIGIGVIALVVIQILFYTATAVGIAVREQGQDEKKIERNLSAIMCADERDHLIELKSYRVGYILVGTGFVTAIAGLAFGLSSVFALHILLGAFAVGSIAEGIASIYFYEKGVRHG